jgi:hypothetical protein
MDIPERKKIDATLPNGEKIEWELTPIKRIEGKLRYETSSDYRVIILASQLELTNQCNDYLIQILTKKNKEQNLLFFGKPRKIKDHNINSLGKNFVLGEFLHETNGKYVVCFFTSQLGLTDVNNDICVEVHTLIHTQQKEKPTFRGWIKFMFGV